MRTEHLRYLLEISKTHSMRIAAERCYVSQSAVSIALKNLERELGTALLSRSKNGVYLTEEGEIVLEKAKEILCQEDAIYSYAADLRHRSHLSLTGTLEVATIPMVSYGFFTETVTQLISKNPSLHLKITEQSSSHALKALQKGQCDLAFFLADASELAKYDLEATCVLQRLFSEKLFVVAHRSFGLGQHKSISLSEIEELPLATGFYDVRENLVEKYSMTSKNMNLVLNTPNMELIMQLVLNGTVISSLIHSLAFRFVSYGDIDVIPAINPAQMDVYCAYRREAQQNALVQAFVNELMEHV